MRQRVKIVIKEEIVRELYAIAGEDAVQTAEPMKNHTTFRVGGPADYFVAPHTEEEIRKIVALCEEKEIPWFVTGNGSNLVVSDEGYHGVILSVYKNFQGIEVEGNRIRAKAGSMLVSISRAAREAVWATSAGSDLRSPESLRADEGMSGASLSSTKASAGTSARCRLILRLPS